jgi:hypothetical protein
MAARVTTAIIPLEDLRWNNLQVTWVVVHWAAEIVHTVHGSQTIAVMDGLLDVKCGTRHSANLLAEGGWIG